MLSPRRLSTLDLVVKAPVVCSRIWGANCRAVFLSLVEAGGPTFITAAFLRSVSLIYTSVEGIIRLSSKLLLVSPPIEEYLVSPVGEKGAFLR